MKIPRSTHISFNENTIMAVVATRHLDTSTRIAKAYRKVAIVVFNCTGVSWVRILWCHGVPVFERLVPTHFLLDKHSFVLNECYTENLLAARLFLQDQKTVLWH